MKGFKEINDKFKVRWTNLMAAYNNLEEDKCNLEDDCKHFNKTLCKWLEDEFKRNGKTNWTVSRDYTCPDATFRLSYAIDDDESHNIRDCISFTEEQMEKEYLSPEDLITRNEAVSTYQIDEQKKERYEMYLKLKAEFENDQSALQTPSEVK